VGRVSAAANLIGVRACAFDQAPGAVVVSRLVSSELVAQFGLHKSAVEVLTSCLPDQELKFRCLLSAKHLSLFNGNYSYELTASKSYSCVYSGEAGGSISLLAQAQLVLHGGINFGAGRVISWGQSPC